MKKVKLANWLLTIIFVGFFAYSQGPAIVSNFQKEGEKLDSYKFMDLERNIREFPMVNEKHVLIYWATWCGPCKLEMRRLQKAVKSGEIEGSNIFAYSPYEDRKTVLKFLEKEPFSFQFIQDGGELARRMNLQMTPTVVHIENKEIKYIGTGISPLLIFRIKSFYRRD